MTREYEKKIPIDGNMFDTNQTVASNFIHNLLYYVTRWVENKNLQRKIKILLLLDTPYYFEPHK